MLQLQRGFTLIELMIVIAIVGLIAAIAIPSYNNMVIKSRRGDAKTSLAEISQLQESYYADHNGYALTLADLKLDKRGYTTGGTSVTSKEGYYSIELKSSSARSYELWATAQGVQKEQDEECPIFVLSSSGKKSTAKAGTGKEKDASHCW